MRCEPRCPIHRKREWRHHMIACETSCNLWRHSGRFTTAVQACVFASIARKTRIDSPPVTVNNPMRTSARPTNPKVMAVVKTAPKSVAEELNRLIAHKTSTKIPIAIRVQPIPMRRAEKNDNAGNRGFFMCRTFWPHHFPSGIQNDVGSASEIISKPRRALRRRISYSWIGDFKNQLARNAVQSRGNFRRFVGRLSVAYEVLLQRIND